MIKDHLINLKIKIEGIKYTIDFYVTRFKNIKNIFNYKIYCWAASPKEWLGLWLDCVRWLARNGTGVTIVRGNQVLASMHDKKTDRG